MSGEMYQKAVISYEKTQHAGQDSCWIDFHAHILRQYSLLTSMNSMQWRDKKVLTTGVDAWKCSCWFYLECCKCEILLSHDHPNHVEYLQTCDFAGSVKKNPYQERSSTTVKTRFYSEFPSSVLTNFVCTKPLLEYRNEDWNTRQSSI